MPLQQLFLYLLKLRYNFLRNPINLFTRVLSEFATACEQSTEFHFSKLDDQLAQISASLERANQANQHTRHTCADAYNLRSGEVYVTRHSNLAEVHVVFHLVVDDSVQTLQSDLSSRHPVILGVRNILKACFHYDIHTVTLPLLLAHEMTEVETSALRLELCFEIGCKP